MMQSLSRFRSLLPAVLLLAAGLLFGTGPAHAQSSKKYQTMYNDARKLAQQGVKAEQSDDIDGAVQKYDTAYHQLAKAANLAKKDGQVEAANQITMLASKLAYRAGSLLHNNGRSDEAVAHFQFGQKIAPPSYTKNTAGLRAARNAQKQGPVVDASRALRDGNPRRTLQLLSELDEQTATSYFYRALAYQELSNSGSAIANASRALSAGGLSTSRRGQMYLVAGEEQMKQGNKDEARKALAQAADVGSSQVRNRAKALIDQL